MDKLTIKTFDGIKQRFVELCDTSTFEKECSFALQHLRKNSYLQKSTPESLLQAVLNIAQVGLTLNPVQKLAYMVPRYNSQLRAVECCLEPSYQGLVKLITDMGGIVNCYAYMVYENDHFEQILGTQNQIIHKPKLGNRGDAIGVYAVAVLAGGGTQCEVMDISEVQEIRNTSESYKAFKNGKVKTCIWEDWFDEMARKTVIKRLVKYLPKTEYETLSKAIDLTNDDWQASYEQKTYIDNLLQTSTIAEEEKEYLSKSIDTYNKDEANQLITRLLNSQVDPVQGGINYSQADIKESLDKHV